jgi:predicted RecB family nuclease
MQKKSGTYLYSPSDLTRYMESPFASWVARYSLESPSSAPQKDPVDDLMATLQDKGYKHEDVLENEFRSQGLDVKKIISGPKNNTFGESVKAMQAGHDVIVQACLEFGEFAGFSDFLVKVPGESNLGDYHYEVWDTKLASKIKPTFIVQLCCYAQMLENIQGVRPHNITVALGNGKKEILKTNDYFYYFLELKKSFLLEQDDFDEDKIPDPADSKSWGSWANYAEQLLKEKDHLIQVATITRSQIAKLNQAGIHTMQELADLHQCNIPGMHSEARERLQAQAAIQIASAGKEVPEFEILQPEEGEKAGLVLLPPKSNMDVFFDIEGNPLDDGGLEYLWGSTYLDDSGEQTFKDFWAHNQDQEKKAFESFIQWVYERWQRDPAMHIYHYANYEIAACRKLMGRYGVCENEVDQLLRNEVFVDLYKIVKGGLRLGEPQYSIKNVEHLYRGKRDTVVGNGGDSVVVYEKWRELFNADLEGDTWETSSILESIRDYNIDDCDSTYELVLWLRRQQVEHGIVFLGKEEKEHVPPEEEVVRREKLRDSLLAKANDLKEKNSSEAALLKNLARTLFFHKREDKPKMWRQFERFSLSHVELQDDLSCIACCERTKREGFKITPKTKILANEYRFDLKQEYKKLGTKTYLLDVLNEKGFPVEIDVIKEHSNLKKGLVVLKTKIDLPPLITLIPNEIVRTKVIQEAIESVISNYYSGTLKNRKNNAIIGFLKREKPKFVDFHEGDIAPSGDSNEKIQQIIFAVKSLDNSYLTIQGPPGTGKTYTGARVIADLLKDGAKIGIASNSHKAINNLLLGAAKYCNEEAIEANFYCNKDTDPGLVRHGVTILENKAISKYVKPACVFGTTAWGFSREDLIDGLDYLFVDEAGQVSVANLIAMSRSASNLVLMGDQMQLGQPIEGVHPGESGLSILDYLLHEIPTIPKDMGVFLDTTYRMHSEVNKFISKHVYDGQLKISASNDLRVIKVPKEYGGLLDKEAGIIFSPVLHEGNSQSSLEEASEILRLAKELIGREFIEGENKKRKITWDDILFVAPYNHQVKTLQGVLGGEAKIGTVDKFQGQEAPIVFLSMCSSDPAESPRGLDFLFDKHRLNVAISRAQCLAIVVANPDIGKTTVSNAHQMKLLNIFDAFLL